MNYTMSVLANSSDISIATFSGSLGAITSVATATDSTLTNVDAIYVPASSSTCTAALSDSLDSQGSVIVASAVSSIFNSISCTKWFSILSVVILFI